MNGYIYQTHTWSIIEPTGPSYLWGTSVIEICLRQYIELWEQINQEGHNSTNHIYLEEECIAKEMRKLHALRHKAKFRDEAMVLENVENFIEIFTVVHKLKEYITMNKEAMSRSVQKAGGVTTCNTQPIYRWL